MSETESNSLTQWTVSGYRRIKVTMVVEAETAWEAVDKAMAGEYSDVDTEPDKDLKFPVWKARKRNPA
jgi:hypothetical protein